MFVVIRGMYKMKREDPAPASAPTTKDCPSCFTAIAARSGHLNLSPGFAWLQGDGALARSPARCGRNAGGGRGRRDRESCNSIICIKSTIEGKQAVSTWTSPASRRSSAKL